MVMKRSKTLKVFYLVITRLVLSCTQKYIDQTVMDNGILKFAGVFKVWYIMNKLLFMCS